MKADALEKLFNRAAILQSRIDAEQAKRKVNDDREFKRLKALIATAILNDTNPQTRAAVLAALQGSIKQPRDKEFLASKGWWEGDKPNGKGTEKDTVLVPGHAEAAPAFLSGSAPRVHERQHATDGGSHLERRKNA